MHGAVLALTLKDSGELSSFASKSAKGPSDGRFTLLKSGQLFYPSYALAVLFSKASMRLSAFIRERKESILQEWEDFARTIEPPSLSMSNRELRDHAAQMLEAIAADLDSSQTSLEQSEKSKGRAAHGDADTAAETHAVARLLSGYTIEQLVSEYRALRASVLHLWAAASKEGLVTDPDDVTRFNESIDQALAESVMRYAKLVNQGQNLFVAILAHDLRNPLGTTVSAANVLATADIERKYRDIAASILRSGMRMGKLVDDLLDYTRSHLGGGLPVAVKKINLAVTCESVIEEMRILHPQRLIEFDAEGDLEGDWDGARIQQGLSNLIGNAFQHGSSSSPVIVRICAATSGITISVNNHGSVIPAGRIHSIFDPLVRFSEYESPNPKPGSSLGIGLYIAREVALAHGGSIDVSSTDAEGTTFSLHLPRSAG
ncbi:sensor histidine kinase [soil metagenome]